MQALIRGFVSPHCGHSMFVQPREAWYIGYAAISGVQFEKEIRHHQVLQKRYTRPGHLTLGERILLFALCVHNANHNANSRVNISAYFGFRQINGAVCVQFPACLNQGEKTLPVEAFVWRNRQLKLTFYYFPQLSRSVW